MPTTFSVDQAGGFGEKKNTPSHSLSGCMPHTFSYTLEICRLWTLNPSNMMDLAAKTTGFDPKPLKTAGFGP